MSSTPSNETDKVSRHVNVPDLYSMLARFILYRLNAGRDVKILIVARGGATGTGKTTLAYDLATWIQGFLQCPQCRFENEHGELVGGFFPRTADQCPWCGFDLALDNGTEWDAEQAFINIPEYQKFYRFRAKSGDALLLDEAEQQADSRRSMSEVNVELSKTWAGMRYKNVVSIVTMPSMLHVDRRLKELGDVLINVQRRGMAYLQWLWLNDETEQVKRKYIKNEYGQDERLFFEPVNDATFREVANLKDTYFTEGSKQFYEEEDVERALAKGKKEAKAMIARRMYDETDMSQMDVADIIDMSQQWVSKAVRGKLDE